MNVQPEKTPPTEALSVRRPYAKPEIQRVDLALEETLSKGCKLETDNACVGPPVTAYEGGS